MMNIVVFSKDRGCQLELFLRSMFKKFPEASRQNISILYTFSGKEMSDGYDKTKALFREYNNINWIVEKDFKKDLLSAIDQASGHTVFFTDDDVFINPFSMSDERFTHFLQETDVVCFSLRLNPYLDFSYSMGKEIIHRPDFGRNGEFSHKGCGSYYGYPMSVDGHIFLTQDILPLLTGLQYKNPNQLESGLAKKPINKSKMMCLEKSVIVNNPENVIQTEFANRNENGDPVAINSKYLSGLYLAYEDYDGMSVKCPHTPVPLRFAPMVSVIIPSFNRLNWLMYAIDSVKKQTYKNYEIIVVDDWSSDLRYQAYDWKKHDIRYFRTENKCYGSHEARNVGLREAKYEWVALLDDDDAWTEDKLEVQMREMTGFDISCTNGFYCRERPPYSQEKTYSIYYNQRYSSFLKKTFEDGKMPCVITGEMEDKNNLLINSSVVLRKDLAVKCGGFTRDPQLRCTDWPLWKKCTKQTDCKYIDVPLIYYNDSPRQRNAQKRGSDLVRHPSSHKLSVIVTGRNDNHAGDYKNRLRTSIETNINLLRGSLACPFEYVIVDWGSDIPLINSDDMAWTTTYPEIKYITVSPYVILQQYGCSRFYQFFAKNVGIKHASGDWELLINADNMLTESLVTKINEAIESDSSNEFYRTRWWKCSTGQVIDCAGGTDKERRLATTYSGDFLLAKKDVLVSSGRGYDESNPCHQTSLPQAQMDGEILFNMKKNGIMPVVWEDTVLHIYHKRSGIYDKEYNHDGYENTDDWGLTGFPLHRDTLGNISISPLPHTNSLMNLFDVMPSENNIAVVLTVWRRIGNLSKTLNQIKNQTFRNFDLFVINNNQDAGCFIERQRKVIGLPMTVYNMPYNAGFVVRHVLARELALSGYEYVIMLDDDASIPDNAFEVMNMEKQPETICSTMCLSFNNVVNGVKKISKYVGPGGMICDTSLFLKQDFWDKWELENQIIDDFWVSYYAGSIGWTLSRSNAGITHEKGVEQDVSSYQKDIIPFLRNQFSQKYQWTTMNFRNPPNASQTSKVKRGIPITSVVPSRTKLNKPSDDKQKMFLDFIPSSSTRIILDVGACECEDSIKFADTYPKAKIYAFEPITDNYKNAKEVLRKRGDDGRIRLYNCACGIQDAYGKMFVSSGNPANGKPGQNYGNKSSSLLPPGRHLEIHPWCKFEREQPVKIVRLDGFCQRHNIENIDILHVDVQGAELDVLRGMGRYLEKVTAIFLEVENIALYKGQPLKDEVEKFMSVNGFVKKIDTVGGVSGDQLWVRPSALKKNRMMKVSAGMSGSWH